MRALWFLPALLCLGAAPPPPAATARPWPMPAFGVASSACPDTPMSLARKARDRAQLHRLDRLPDAQAFAAVDRRSAGCPAPMSLDEARSGR
jgi:hypothetical protein